MNSIQDLGGRISSSICALRFHPQATVAVDVTGSGTREDVFRHVTQMGVLVSAYECGVFVFDCEAWKPGAAVEIPRVEAQGGERLLRTFTQADTEAFVHVVVRCQMMNAFLACMSTAISEVQKTALIIGQEITPANYVSIPIDRQQTAALGSLEVDRLLSMRNHPKEPPGPLIVLRAETITRACELLDQTLGNDATFQLVDLLYRACWRYAQHDFSMASVIAWTVCEKLVNVVWEKHLASVGGDQSRKPRVSGKRLKKLTGRDFTASIITEFLELHGLISFDMYERLNSARQARNEWMHGLNGQTDRQATDVLGLAQEFLNHVFGLKLTIQLGRSTSY